MEGILMQHALATLALLLSLLAPSGEVEFDYWSGHPVGAWVKLKMEVETQGIKVVVDTQHTLLQLTAEKALIERKSKVSTNGMEQPESLEKEELLAGKDKDPVTITREGDEEIEAGGKKLKCHWIEGTQKETHKVKYWVSKEISGGVAKAEVSGGDIPAPMKITATAWGKK
ncbi:MAG TPA: hypothetical protein VMU54_14100 [Planctomycetota bacterium]|nr:hypothetical protein [Planctomycetota bacterium]